MMGKMLSSISVLPIHGVDVSVSDITLDSRQVVEGGLYCAVGGARTDGHCFVAEAIERGALAIVLEDSEKAELHDIAYIEDKALKTNLSQMSSEFFDKPSEKLSVVAVTGTNGKTSVVHFVAQLLEALGESCASIGTLGVTTGGVDTPDSVNTTPDAITVQRVLHSAVANGDKYVAMEVTSHAVEQHRVDAVKFSTAVFTNLSHDHLDYHGSMESYFAAKKKLFDFEGIKTAVVNIDDKYGQQLSEVLDIPTLTYSVKSANADCYIEKVESAEGGFRRCFVSMKGKRFEFTTELVGLFNLSNLLAALLVVAEQGFSIERIFQYVSKVQAAPGRLQLVSNESGGMAVVDYAHTPDALENVLKALQPYRENKLITVFGCGGDRDKGKRPLMARIAEAYSDFVVVTSDNPRTESISEINADISEGFLGKSFSLVEDRKQAISDAVAMAGCDDVILIAGKGHEEYQQIGDKKIPFNDVSVLSNLLAGGVQ